MNDNPVWDATVLSGMLGSIAASLAEIARNTARERPEAPDLQRPLDAFTHFDWASIDATVVREDEFGPALVEWEGRLWTRRAPENKFDAALWFSRAAGKDDEGKQRYLRLITFRAIAAAEPVSRAVELAIRKPSPPNGAHPAARDLPKPAPVPSPAAAADPDWDALTSRTQERAGLPEPDPALACPNCGRTFQTANPACPDHRSPPITRQLREPAGKPTRQATIAAGKVGAEFRLWTREFAAHHPHYALKGDGGADLYHILMTVASLHYEIVDADNIAAVQSALDAHATGEGVPA